MTTATHLGEENARKRKISFNPRISGGDHAKGKSIIKSSIKYSSPALDRYKRRRDRRANIESRKILTSQVFNYETNPLNLDQLEVVQLEEPLEEIYQ